MNITAIILFIILILIIVFIILIAAKNTPSNIIGGKKNKSINKIKHNNEQTTSKCSIDDHDYVLFGDGGSSAIIVISKNKVYKIFTLYQFKPDLDEVYDFESKFKNKRVENEIKIYELLTKNIINKKLSNHIVRYFGTNKCKDAKSLFKNCPKSYVDFMRSENKSKMCIELFKNYPNRKLSDNFKVIEIEHCNYSCKDFIEEVSHLSEFEMEKYLDIFFFQIIHTILTIQKTYPYFTHNDLFMRNILGFEEKDNGNYYTYHFDDKVYYIPQKKFYPKINDFGMTNLNDEYKNIKLYKSEYKDIYNILFDIYNGQNLGSKSLCELCKDDENKIKFLKRYFSTYFDVYVIDEYKITAKGEMDRNWSNILDDKFLQSIKMKHPKDLLDHYFYDIFGKINKNLDSNLI